MPGGEGPGPLPNIFAVGDTVDVRSYGQATVISITPPDKHVGKVQIQYHDNGSTYWANPAHIRHLVPTTKRVLVSPTTKQYRAAMVQNVRSTDVCLEIGCHEGITTAMLHRRVKSVVGVDMSAKTIDTARKSHPQCRFEVCDGNDVTRLRSFSPREDGSYDKILVDIGGIVPLTPLMHMISTLLKSFRTSTLLIKSIHLARFLEISEVFSFDANRQWANPSALGPIVSSPIPLTPEEEKQEEEDSEEEDVSG